MLRVLLLVVAATCAAAFSPLVTPSPAARLARAQSPSMACNGGKGGRGGKSPPKDKARRGKLKRLIYAADSAEGVKSILLSSQTESMILKMNWKVRKTAKHHLTKRAAQFDVEVPSEFAGFHHLNPSGNGQKQMMKKHLLVPTVTEQSPRDAAAVAALANLRAA